MIILGSTGSIGVSAFEIATKSGIQIEMLSCGENIDLLNAQIALAKPTFVAIKDSTNAKSVDLSHGAKLFIGESGILEALNLTQSDLVLNALVGISGLKPSVESLRLNKTLALANKESLVVGGEFLESKRIIPVDSEHFALRELIAHKPHIKRLIITASGGALRDCALESIASQSPQSVLNHPNWKMGKKITTDSATMANKLFEILEAKWLFGIDNIDAVIERNSVIHAFVECADNSIVAHLSANDMRLPIAYAILGEKARNAAFVKEINVLDYSFQFSEIDTRRYPLWNLKNNLLKTPRLGIILNAANEILVARFLKNNIAFGQISEGIFEAIGAFEGALRDIGDISDIVALDSEVRDFSKAFN